MMLVVNGDAWAVNYYGYENAVPRVVVTGGTISGELAKGVGNGSADMVKEFANARLRASS